jgi:hypothetical protein
MPYSTRRSLVEVAGIGIRQWVESSFGRLARANSEPSQNVQTADSP